MSDNNTSSILFTMIIPPLGFILFLLRPPLADLYTNHFTAFGLGFIGVVMCIIGISLYIYKIEYNRIKNKDFDRVKKTLTRYLKKSFVLVEEEKGLTKKDINKRCFTSYQTKFTVFVPDGELLCTVNVSEYDVDVMKVKRVSKMNLNKELYVS
ncbi:hypothetical protein [Bacillus paranthracis]|uniref:hypothetical protein n=1 Tax=Bacillus paranthracis TaxID=2026186 RepID=UPI002FDBDE8A|nr:hypothetical protein [Bacillus paranthracis]